MKNRRWARFINNRGEMIIMEASKRRIIKQKKGKLEVGEVMGWILWALFFAIGSYVVYKVVEKLVN